MPPPKEPVMDTEPSLATAGIIAVGGDAPQYLTFILAGEEYGLDILRVQEIRGWDAVTPIPNTPSCLKGVINLRGAIVPIIDLRLRFGLEALPYGPTTVVIVLKVDGESGDRIMGIVVDAVSDVHSITSEAMQPPPDFVSAISTEYFKGLATIDEQMVVLLNVDRLLNTGPLAIADGMMRNA